LEVSSGIKWFQLILIAVAEIEVYLILSEPHTYDILTFPSHVTFTLPLSHQQQQSSLFPIPF
jgi:hypothetical protein